MSRTTGLPLRYKTRRSGIRSRMRIISLDWPNLLLDRSKVVRFAHCSSERIADASANLLEPTYRVVSSFKCSNTKSMIWIHFLICKWRWYRCDLCLSVGCEKRRGWRAAREIQRLPVMKGRCFEWTGTWVVLSGASRGDWRNSCDPATACGDWRNLQAIRSAEILNSFRFYEYFQYKFNQKLPWCWRYNTSFSCGVWYKPCLRHWVFSHFSVIL